MTVSPSFLIRAAGAAAVAAGALFVGVQIGHPPRGITSITTTEVAIRAFLKVLMAALALAVITGMYLSQVRRNGVVGHVGYLVAVGGLVSAVLALLPDALYRLIAVPNGVPEADQRDAPWRSQRETEDETVVAVEGHLGRTAVR